MPKQNTAEELTILRTIVGDLLKRGGITVATIEAELERREVAKREQAEAVRDGLLPPAATSDLITISEKGEITITFDSSLSEEVTVAAAKADTTVPRYIVDAIASAIERSRG